jgi:hypothetical protein
MGFVSKAIQSREEEEEELLTLQILSLVVETEQIDFIYLSIEFVMKVLTV